MNVLIQQDFQLDVLTDLTTFQKEKNDTSFKTPSMQLLESEITLGVA